MASDGEAWVEIPSTEELRVLIPADAGHPYDFGFLPAMARLIAAHSQIAMPFASLFAQVMFAPGHLERSEREMVAAVAAAAQDCFY